MASILVPELILGTAAMMAAASAAAAVPGGGVGTGHGSRILVNTRGGGLDAWAWQNGEFFEVDFGEGNTFGFGSWQIVD